jgi:TRAP-type uncharacterized transport system fused permease subunit
MLTRPTPALRTYVVVAAGAATVVSPLLALAWFDTADGAEFAASSTVAWWAEPARSLAGGLLTFADADRVYAMYTQVMALLFPAVPLAAAAARSASTTRDSAGGRWGWRLALSGYALFAVGLLAAALLQVHPSTAGALDVAFVAAMMPGLLLSLIGSTALGVALLRARHRPRVTAWLLVLCIPLWVLGGLVLGHNSLGLLPLFAAWAATAWIWRQQSVEDWSPATV